jgi:hypothetical protein
MDKLKSACLLTTKLFLLMILNTCVFDSSTFALNARNIVANRSLIRSVQRDSTMDSISLGNLSVNSQTQSLTFPMVLGVTERISMDGMGDGSGVLVNNTSTFGYSVKVDSIHGGHMTGAASGLTIPYTLIVDNVSQSTLPSTSSSAPLTIITGSGTATNELHPIQISHGNLPLNQAADTYTDSITFYLYAN